MKKPRDTEAGLCTKPSETFCQSCFFIDRKLSNISNVYHACYCVVLFCEKWMWMLSTKHQFFCCAVETSSMILCGVLHFIADWKLDTLYCGHKFCRQHSHKRIYGWKILSARHWSSSSFLWFSMLRSETWDTENPRFQATISPWRLPPR